MRFPCSGEEAQENESIDADAEKRFPEGPNSEVKNSEQVRRRIVGSLGESI